MTFKGINKFTGKLFCSYGTYMAHNQNLCCFIKATIYHNIKFSDNRVQFGSWGDTYILSMYQSAARSVDSYDFQPWEMLGHQNF